MGEGLAGAGRRKTLVNASGARSRGPVVREAPQGVVEGVRDPGRRTEYTLKKNTKH